MTSRFASRAAVLALTGVALSVASPAAVVRDGGDDPGEQLSGLGTLLLFVGAPVGLFVLIALLVLAPSLAKGPRYRPGLGWQGTSEWYGGSEEGAGSDTEGAPEAGDSGTSARW